MKKSKFTLRLMEELWFSIVQEEQICQRVLRTGNPAVGSGHTGGQCLRDLFRINDIFLFPHKLGVLDSSRTHLE